MNVSYRYTHEEACTENMINISDPEQYSESEDWKRKCQTKRRRKLSSTSVEDNSDRSTYSQEFKVPFYSKKCVLEDGAQYLNKNSEQREKAHSKSMHHNVMNLSEELEKYSGHAKQKKKKRDKNINNYSDTEISIEQCSENEISKKKDKREKKINNCSDTEISIKQYNENDISREKEKKREKSISNYNVTEMSIEQYRENEKSKKKKNKREKNINNFSDTEMSSSFNTSRKLKKDLQENFGVEGDLPCKQELNIKVDIPNSENKKLKKRDLSGSLESYSEYSSHTSNDHTSNNFYHSKKHKKHHHEKYVKGSESTVKMGFQSDSVLSTEKPKVEKKKKKTLANNYVEGNSEYSNLESDSDYQKSSPYHSSKIKKHSETAETVPDRILNADVGSLSNYSFAYSLKDNSNKKKKLETFHNKTLNTTNIKNAQICKKLVEVVHSQNLIKEPVHKYNKKKTQKLSDSPQKSYLNYFSLKYAPNHYMQETSVKVTLRSSDESEDNETLLGSVRNKKKNFSENYEEAHYNKEDGKEDIPKVSADNLLESNSENHIRELAKRMKTADDFMSKIDNLLESGNEILHYDDDQISQEKKSRHNRNNEMKSDCLDVEKKDSEFMSKIDNLLEPENEISDYDDDQISQKKKSSHYRKNEMKSECSDVEKKNSEFMSKIDNLLEPEDEISDYDDDQISLKKKSRHYRKNEMKSECSDVEKKNNEFMSKIDNRLESGNKILHYDDDQISQKSRHDRNNKMKSKCPDVEKKDNDFMSKINNLLESGNEMLHYEDDQISQAKSGHDQNKKINSKCSKVEKKYSMKQSSKGEMSNFSKTLSLEQIEELDNEQSQRREKVQYLEIESPWELPPIHRIASHVSTCPTAKQKENLEAEGIQLKRGKYTKEEDNKIRENWRVFCEIYDWDINDTEPFVHGTNKAKLGCLDKKQLQKFVEFISHGIEDRLMYNIYMRFQRLFSRHEKRKFTPEEDMFILNHTENAKNQRVFADLSGLMKRSRLSLLKRRNKLLECHSKKLTWNAELIETFLRKLLEVTQVKDIASLKNCVITESQWQAISDEIGYPVFKLKQSWEGNLCARISSANYGEELHEVQQKLLDILYDRYEDYREIDWHALEREFDNGFSHEKLNRTLRDLIKVRVPREIKSDMKECLTFLKNDLKERKWKICGKTFLEQAVQNIRKKN